MFQFHLMESTLQNSVNALGPSAHIRYELTVSIQRNPRRTSPGPEGLLAYNFADVWALLPILLSWVAPLALFLLVPRRPPPR